MAKFIPLDGTEIIEAVVADVRASLEARHDLFSHHLAYPRVDWHFQVDFDFYHSQETVVTTGGHANGAPFEEGPERISVSKGRKVLAPDQIREEVIGLPRVQEDKGESASAISPPQNDGLIRVVRP